MKRSNRPPNVWNWRIGALNCKHRCPSPTSSRVWWCGLWESPRRCMRSTCVDVSEEKRVITDGKAQSQPTETIGEIMAAQANKRINENIARVNAAFDSAAPANSISALQVEIAAIKGMIGRMALQIDRICAMLKHLEPRDESAG